MAEATFTFPKGFLWGTATSSHQNEGNNTNNQWWAWEQQTGKIIDEHQSRLACDWWNGRWREDFDRAAETSQNTLRLGIEWSRIQPSPSRWDEDSLDYYREIMRGLHERGLKPMVTLHHFTNPIWFEEMGGWENPEAVSLFEKFVRKSVEALQEYVEMWCTINEPNVYAVLSYQMGAFPPGKKDNRSFFIVTENLIRAHAAAYQAIHESQQNSRVGIVINYRSFVPSRDWSVFDKTMAKFQAHHFNNLVPLVLQNGKARTVLGNLQIPEAKGTLDFFGLNYYTRDYVSFNLLKPKDLFSRRYYRQGAILSDTGFIANEPEGMYEALQWANQYGVPIIITENGVEDADDHMRPRYIVEHLHQVWRALNHNLPIQGYYYWTLVDNFEWERGWTQRFGLWELDIENQNRRKRPSVDLYAEICRQNALTSETVARYVPEIFDDLFPN